MWPLYSHGAINTGLTSINLWNFAQRKDYKAHIMTNFDILKTDGAAQDLDC